MRPCSPVGPWIFLFLSGLLAIGMTISARPLIDTISSDPMFTGPVKLERIRRTVRFEAFINEEK